MIRRFGAEPGDSPSRPYRRGLTLTTDRLLFFDQGVILEEGTPEQFFKEPKHEWTKQFLSQILAH